jgi:hypothetical protein
MGKVQELLYLECMLQIEAKTTEVTDETTWKEKEGLKKLKKRRI